MMHEQAKPVSRFQFAPAVPVSADKPLPPSAGSSYPYLQLAPTLFFAGYAALFNRVDSGRDVILPGAFERNLDERRVTGEPLPLLWQHRPDQRIGEVLQAAEDARGLRVIARIDNPHSRAATRLQDRSLSGLSFGYRTRLSRMSSLADGRMGRELIEVELFEISLVSRPMQHGARVHFVT